MITTHEIPGEIAECPICAPVIEAIADAQDAHQLLHLFRVIIPQLHGVTEEQRQALVELLDRKFSRLNGQAVNQKPRWRGGKQNTL